MASTVSLKFLRRFQTLETLNVPEAEVERIRGLLDSLHAGTEAGAKETLSELRQFGTRRVWGDLERSYVDRGRPFRVGYDRFAAAAPPRSLPVLCSLRCCTRGWPGRSQTANSPYRLAAMP